MASPKLALQDNKVLGFAYGTFDLLHPGHLHFLRHACGHCDELIVAIDSDRFAAQLKGPGRPVENAAVRSQHLVASGLVNLVLEVDNVDHLFAAVDYYQPDRVFFGNDGRVAEPADSRVILIPMLPGHSTDAAIRQRLQ